MSNSFESWIQLKRLAGMKCQRLRRVGVFQQLQCCDMRSTDPRTFCGTCKARHDMDRICIQIAAMALRFIEDLHLEKRDVGGDNSVECRDSRQQDIPD